jgi:hypothetical protein
MDTSKQQDILQPLRAEMLKLIGRAGPVKATINGDYVVSADSHRWSYTAGLATHYTTADEVSFIELAHLADAAAEKLSNLAEATPA